MAAARRLGDRSWEEKGYASLLRLDDIAAELTPAAVVAVLSALAPLP
jgi:hypothetical protein